MTELANEPAVVLVCVVLASALIVAEVALPTLGLAGFTGAALPTSFTKKHDSVYVVATPNDGDGDGASRTSSTVTVASSPTMSLTIDPRIE